MLLVSRSGPLKQFLGRKPRVGFGLLSNSLGLNCHLTNLIPVSTAPDGSRSVVVEDGSHKSRDRGPGSTQTLPFALLAV